MRLGSIAASAGKGLAAGLAGTIVMTVSSTLEARLRKRGSSPTPGRALERVLHVVPEGPEAEQRLSQIGHYGYGTAWGAARGLIAALGIPRALAPVTHWAAVWGAGQAMMPRLGLSPPTWKLGAREAAVDAFHHVVYVVATDVAYAALDRE